MKGIEMRRRLTTFIALVFGIIGANAHSLSVNDIGAHKAIKAATNGDVNGDGSVTIADVTALVNIILGNSANPTEEGEENVADVNQDGSVTIADVTALVNIILGNSGGGNDDPDTPGIGTDPPIDIGDGDLPVDARGNNSSGNWQE